MASQMGCYGCLPELAVVGVLFVSDLGQSFGGFGWGLSELGGGTMDCFVCVLDLVGVSGGERRRNRATTRIFGGFKVIFGVLVVCLLFTGQWSGYGFGEDGEQLNNEEAKVYQ
ncbi:hypothetical protein KY290_033525 [Solanum tuberosum]|uniref:Transmembrane protein n=2 Tax=Solanum tuberosum TaxID=4113 RepID=M1ABZ0_SOLTU|nr:hypothetical protein KY289_032884 [Solanum tuberosum]KAH0647531.1 hypothetical protein KY285_032779 [Solanum tuberosum]KAH0740482.1 hypothetical protein KY290_033525 [Solanum tuberosum]